MRLYRYTISDYALVLLAISLDTDRVVRIPSISQGKRARRLYRNSWRAALGVLELEDGKVDEAEKRLSGALQAAKRVGDRH